MEDKSYTVRVPKRWARIALIVGVTALIVAPLTAVATHSFTDVSDSNTFHADIAWLADSGVTKGCNPPANTEFCPDDSVTREQMSAFMRRLAQYLGAEDGTPAQADHATTADNATTAGDADTLQGLEPTAFYTTEEVDAMLSTPLRIGNHNGVGNNAGCLGSEVSVVITDANGNPRDARFSFQLGDNEAYGQIRSGGSIRNSSTNVIDVVHEPDSGIYCIQFTAATTTQTGRESAVMSLHATDPFPVLFDLAGGETLPGND
jgi:hypothetical protein